MITKMQRDLYSKKENSQGMKASQAEEYGKRQKSRQDARSPIAILHGKKVFQEDINPSEALQSIKVKNNMQRYKECSRNTTNMKFKTDDHSKSKSNTTSFIEVLEIKDEKNLFVSNRPSLETQLKVAP